MALAGPCNKFVSLFSFFKNRNGMLIMTVTFFKSTAIRQEIRDIERGVMDKTNNPLKVG